MSNHSLKTLVISLLSALDRREKISTILQNQKFEFINGVNGKNIDIENIPLYRGSKRRAYFGKDLITAELGCFLAHMNAIQKVVDDNEKYILILEDDVELHDNFFPTINKILESQFEFELIRFLGHPKTIKQGCRPVQEINNYMIGRLKTTPGGGYAYILSNSGARKILKHIKNNGIYLPSDILLGFQWETKINGYAILSDLATSKEDQTISLIGNERFNINNTENKPPYYFITRAYFKLSTAIKKNILYYFRR